MSKRPAKDRLIETWMSPRLYRFLMTRGGRFQLIVLAALAVAAVAIISHIYGRYLASGEIMERDQTIQLMQSEGQKLATEVNERDARIAILEGQIKKLQDALAAIVPAKDTYDVKPNQSIVVADGRLTIGLIGPPTNEAVVVNINGKQQAAAAGDILHSTLDASTTCQVTVQSFDMFKAVLAASCAAAKAQ